MTRKEIAADFLTMASAGKVQEAFAAHIHSDFFHHNAYFKGDRESLLTAMEKSVKDFPNKTYQILRSLEDGNLVTIHGKVSGVFNKSLAVIHIFRFDGDKIIESWEASQENIDSSPNTHGIF